MASAGSVIGSGGLGHGPVDALEVLEGGELDDDPALPVPELTFTRVSRWLESSSSSSRMPGGRSRVERSAVGGAVGLAELVAVPDRVLDGPNGELLGRPLAGRAPPGRPGPGVPSRARACPAVSWPSPTSFCTAGGSWNSRSVLVIATLLLPDPAGQLLVRQPEVLDELLVGAGLLEGVEVLAVEVLDQRLLDAVHIRRLADDRRDGGQARPAWLPATAARRRSARRRPRRCRAPEPAGGSRPPGPKR